MINFGTGKIIATPTYDSLGKLLLNPTPVRLGTMQDISVDIDVDLKTLYGSKRFPISVGQGKGKIEIKAKYAEINGAILGSLQFGKTASAGVRAAVFDFVVKVPAAEAASQAAVQVTVEPPQDATFATDLGVLDAATTESLERAAVIDGQAPAVGHYTVSNGVYRFAPSTQDRMLLISYEYRAESGKGQIFQLTNDVMGPTPAFSLLLQNSFDGKNLVMKFNRAVSSKVSLPLKNDDYAVYDLSAQAFADAADEIGYLCLF
ncbi:hypothetical protein [Rhizobacter sp. P5_C2]